MEKGEGRRGGEKRRRRGEKKEEWKKEEWKKERDGKEKGERRGKYVRSPLFVVTQNRTAMNEHVNILGKASFPASNLVTVNYQYLDASDHRTRRIGGGLREGRGWRMEEGGGEGGKEEGESRSGKENERRRIEGRRERRRRGGEEEG